MRVSLGAVVAACVFLGACGGEPLAQPGGSVVGAHVAPYTAAPHPPCTVFVTPGGSSRDSGATRSRPTSLTAGAARVRARGVLCLEPGVYRTRSNLTLTRSGSRAAPTVMTGDGGPVEIDYRGRPRDGGVVQTTYCKPWCATHDLV